MLKGIDHRPNAEVLACPCAIGHGDLLLLADADFPAGATVTARRLRMEYLSAAEAAAAILSVLPLDSFVDDFAGRMEGVGAPDEVPPVQKEVQAEIDRAEGRARPMLGIERFAFYDLARQFHAVIQTGERRFYGCFMFRKGVIPPEV